MNKLLKSRTDDVVVQKVGNSVYVYDRRIDNFSFLNGASAIVFQACERQTSIDELKAERSLSDEVIFSALEELKRQNLLETGADVDSSVNGFGYREAFKNLFRRLGFRQSVP